MQLRTPALSRFVFAAVVFVFIAASTGLAAPRAFETPSSTSPSNSIETIVEKAEGSALDTGQLTNAGTGV